MVKRTTFEEAILVAYDLRDDEAQRDAHRARWEWGKAYTDIYTLDNDHVALAFRPGGALEIPDE